MEIFSKQLSNLGYLNVCGQGGHSNLGHFMEFLEVFWCCGSHDIDLNLFLLHTLWMALKVVSNFIILTHEQLLFCKDLVLLPSK